MTKESQNIEWKESWHSDYFKWICGFANAHGGTLYIGKDDNGKVKHLPKAKKMLEDLPNQVKDLMGLLVEVNLHTESGQDYIEIKVDKYPFPISYKGKYYYRTGSTMQELNGAALSKFVLASQGKRWDGVPIPDAPVSELSSAAISLFKAKAAKSQRVNEDDLNGNADELMECLHLKDGEHLKRAAILLFHPEPEKYFTGAAIKIGLFKSDDSLVFQDEVKGSLLEQAEKALDLLVTKYGSATISFEKGVRVETFAFPKAAIREALLNAIAHKDYSSGIAIQISVYENKIIFYNAGQLPDQWTVEKLKVKHPSKPFNPDIANTLFRAGYIESWGSGTIKMIAACAQHKIAPPVFASEAPDFQVTFIKYTDDELTQMGLGNTAYRKILLYIQDMGSIGNTEVQTLCGVSKPTATRYLQELEGDYLEKKGSTGVGTTYILKGLTKGS